MGSAEPWKTASQKLFDEPSASTGVEGGSRHGGFGLQDLASAYVLSLGGWSGLALSCAVILGSWLLWPLLSGLRLRTEGASATAPRRRLSLEDDEQQQEEPPEDLVCPISFQVMQNPVMLCCTGQVYDYPNLRSWLTLGNMVCPRTNMPMYDVQVVRLTALKERCREWMEAAGTPLPQDPTPVQLELQDLNPQLPDWLQAVRGSGSLDKRGAAAAKINDLVVKWTSRSVHGQVDLEDDEGNFSGAGAMPPLNPHTEGLMKALKEWVIDDLLWLVRYGNNYGKGCAANALSCFTLPQELAWIAVCGAVPLVATLQSPDAYARQAAARVINNIVHGSEVVRNILGEAGAVQGMLWQIESKMAAGPYTRAPAAQGLWGLAHSGRWRKAIIESGGVASLKGLIHEGTRYEQRDAAGALLQMALAPRALGPDITKQYLLQLRHCSQDWLLEKEGAALGEVEDAFAQEVEVHQYM